MRSTKLLLHGAVGVAAASLVLAACGGDDDPDDAGAPENGDEAPVEAASSITASMISFGASIPDNDVIGPAIEEATGVAVELNVVAAIDDHYNQLGASFAAGETSDLVQVDRARLQQYADQGLILDVTDYLDSDLGDYMEWVSAESLVPGVIGGKNYGLPKKRSPGSQVTYWIRQDWLDTLGLDIPDTTDAFTEVLRAFTEDDPDGNGQDDTYGLTGAQNLNAFIPIWGAFGTGVPEGFYDVNGEIVSGYAAPGAPDAIEYISGLVEAGYTDPDMFTLQPQPALDRALQGTAGVAYTGFTNMRRSEAALGDASTAEWVQMLGPSGPGGGPTQPFDTQNLPMWAIPASVQDDPAKLQAIFDVLNYLSSDEGQRLSTFGIEGTDWEMVDGEPQVTEEAASKSEAERGFTWMYQLAGRDDAVWFTKGGTPWTAEEAEFALNQPKLPEFRSIVTAPDGFNIADANRFAQENLVQFLSGEKSTDEYDDFVDTLYGQFGYQAYEDTAAEQVAVADQ